jgi:hypothetical protein
MPKKAVKKAGVADPLNYLPYFVRAGFRLIFDILSIDRRLTNDSLKIGHIVFDGKYQRVFATNSCALVSLKMPIPFKDVRALRISSVSRCSASVKKKAEVLEPTLCYGKDVLKAMKSGVMPFIRPHGVVVTGDRCYGYLPELDSFTRYHLPKFRRLSDLKFAENCCTSPDGVVLNTFTSALRDSFLAEMKNALAAATNPVMPACSDIRDWLVNIGVLDRAGDIVSAEIRLREVIRCLEFPFVNRIGIWRGVWSKLEADDSPWNPLTCLLFAGDYFRFIQQLDVKTRSASG